jgi:hypothetical protein
MLVMVSVSKAQTGRDVVTEGYRGETVPQFLKMG